MTDLQYLQKFLYTAYFPAMNGGVLGTYHYYRKGIVLGWIVIASRDSVIITADNDYGIFNKDGTIIKSKHFNPCTIAIKPYLLGLIWDELKHNRE